MRVFNIIVTPTTIEPKYYHVLEAISACNLKLCLNEYLFPTKYTGNGTYISRVFNKRLTDDWGWVRGRQLEILSNQEHLQIN